MRYFGPKGEGAPIAGAFISLATWKLITSTHSVEAATTRSTIYNCFALSVTSVRVFKTTRNLGPAIAGCCQPTGAFHRLPFPKRASLRKPGGPGLLNLCGAFTGNASSLHAGDVASATVYSWRRCWPVLWRSLFSQAKAAMAHTRTVKVRQTSSNIALEPSSQIWRASLVARQPDSSWPRV